MLKSLDLLFLKPLGDGRILEALGDRGSRNLSGILTSSTVAREVQRSVRHYSLQQYGLDNVRSL